MSTDIAEPKLRVRLNHIDHILVPPGPFDNSTLPRVPIIRVYGSSQDGKTTAVHIHQVFPYFYVEYPGNLNLPYVENYVSKLKRSLNQAIAISLKRNPLVPDALYIRAIVLVKGVHFYGFHSSYSPFLKIYVANPALVQRAVTLLRSGTVMSTQYRVFESHLNFALQFMCDFGLYGCGWMDLADAYERRFDNTDTKETSSSTNLKPSPCPRQSCLPLELDVIAPHILNRHRTTARPLNNQSKTVPPTTLVEPLVLSVRELWEDERNRRISKGLDPSPEIPIDPSDAPRAARSPWVAEARWWEEIRKKIEREREVDVTVVPRLPEPEWEKRSMTTYESVQALWDPHWQNAKPGQWPSGAINSVDETRNQSVLKEEDVDVDFEMLESDELSQVVDLEPRVDEDEDSWDEEAPDDALGEPEGGHATPRPKTRESTPNPFQVSSDEMQPTPVPLRFRRSAPDATGAPSLHIENDENFTTHPIPSVNRASSSHHRHRPSPSGSSIRRTPSRRTPFPSPTKRQKTRHARFEDRALEIEESSSLPTSVVSRRLDRPDIHQMALSHAVLLTKKVNTNRHVYNRTPPTTLELLETLEEHNIARKLYRAPFYSEEIDIPERSWEYGGLMFNLKGGRGISHLSPWESASARPTGMQERSSWDLFYMNGWEYASSPPSASQTKKWLQSEEGKKPNVPKRKRAEFQVGGVTQKNIYGLKNTFAAEVTSVMPHHDRSNMSTFALEVFSPSRGDNLPNSKDDPISAAFISSQTSESSAIHSRTIVVQTRDPSSHRFRDLKPTVVSSELELLNAVVDTVMELDPDILTGWEVQQDSWGYLTARGQTYGLDVVELISRCPTQTRAGIDQWGQRHSSTLKIGGRHVLNLWRIMRSEQALTSYTFENVAFHVLQQRIPHYSAATLTEWFYSKSPNHGALMMSYFSTRTSTVLRILEESEVVTRTAEFARVFGVDFFSILSRGSQYKVESFMLRIAKPESFVLLSPSKHDVGRQNAAECMPLVMEPLSSFYSSPLLVLDFQSLYPSIMIAYNYCYSTCLGRVTEFQGRNKFGVSEIDVPPGLLEKLQEHINVAPNGIIYVKPEVRKGLLGRMLVELLETRVMVKQAMKGVSDKGLRRILDARQRGLKYIANVTYGYTSASFSGRMPAVGIADSIVQSGRETLEKAIMLIDSTPKWGAKVVYGDTDSVFVYLRGKTKEQAFQIGNDIADTITALNPVPIKLKFEKVYHPCVLMAKKRYVGLKFEHIDDTEGSFDAKGIETVRRDGVPAQQKMVETCLKMLFRSQDLSEVKAYCRKTWTNILENRISAQDFIFAKEVRMGTYSDKVPPPPGVTVAARRMMKDKGYEPQYGDRIPYVIVRGSSNLRLVDRAMDPLKFLENGQLQLDGNYYISRVLIPPLERIFNLVGADVRQWFNDMPKAVPLDPTSPTKTDRGGDEEEEEEDGGANTNDGPIIEVHFHGSQCILCGAPAEQDLCFDCWNTPDTTVADLAFRIRGFEQQLKDIHLLCVSCTRSAPTDEIRCESLDCPALFARVKAEDQMELLVTTRELLSAVEADIAESEIPAVDSDDEQFEGTDEEVDMDSE